MSSRRGRKRNDNLPPNRAREVQRAFRARRAAHLRDLEERNFELEQENKTLRLALQLPPANRPPLGRGPTGKDKPRGLSAERSPSEMLVEASITSDPTPSPVSSDSAALLPVSMSPNSSMTVIEASGAWDSPSLLLDHNGPTSTTSSATPAPDYHRHGPHAPSTVPAKEDHHNRYRSAAGIPLRTQSSNGNAYSEGVDNQSLSPDQAYAVGYDVGSYHIPQEHQSMENHTRTQYDYVPMSYPGNVSGSAVRRSPPTQGYSQRPHLHHQGSQQPLQPQSQRPAALHQIHLQPMHSQTASSHPAPHMRHAQDQRNSLSPFSHPRAQAESHVFPVGQNYHLSNDAQAHVDTRGGSFDIRLQQYDAPLPRHMSYIPEAHVHQAR
ncbi:hypothetical protein BKA70DRAFT_1277283 [Coprinopsis sp. MPI-PUGE-AT-0042]|nr:hypothetical protein BKA70DRAFT_1277283 [Coprinopsis sp. MPI-PUGE-AT-0042]